MSTDWRKGLAHRPKPHPDVAAGVCFYGMRMVTTDEGWEQRLDDERRGPRLHRRALRTDYWSKRRPFREGAKLREHTTSLQVKEAHANFPKIKARPWKQPAEPKWAAGGVHKVPPFSRIDFMDKVQRELDAGSTFGGMRPADGIARKDVAAIHKQPPPATLGRKNSSGWDGRVGWKGRMVSSVEQRTLDITQAASPQYGDVEAELLDQCG